MARIDELLQAATQRLSAVHEDNPRLEAEILLCHVLGKGRSYLRAWPEAQLGADRQQAFEALLARRIAGEPVAHLTGEREFWSLPLTVSPATLIPRPETELLVEQALARIPVAAPWRIADLGTGSGAIALALARERPGCRLIAVDRSAEALQVARHNAHKLQLANISFVHGHWLEAFPAAAFELIVSNPPYIAEADPHLGRGDLRFEPRQALASGPEGLDDIEQIIAQARQALKPGGWLLIEHGYDQGKAVAQRLCAAGYRAVRTHPDWQGHPRLCQGQIPTRSQL